MSLLDVSKNSINKHSANIWFGVVTSEATVLSPRYSALWRPSQFVNIFSKYRLENRSKI